MPGATETVSPGAAASIADWIEVVLPVAATLIVFACAAEGSAQKATPASTTGRSRRLLPKNT